jgi:hypothetical protein
MGSQENPVFQSIPTYFKVLVGQGVYNIIWLYVSIQSFHLSMYVFVYDCLCITIHYHPFMCAIMCYFICFNRIL